MTDDFDDREISRRRLLGTNSAVVAGLLAGCSQTESPGDSDDVGGSVRPDGGDTHETTVTLESTAIAERPVSNELFGRFAEHYGTEIYPGLAAEYLANGSFHDWNHDTATEPPRTTLRYDVSDREDDGVSYPWEPLEGDVGVDGEAEFERPKGGVRGGEESRFQRITVEDGPGGLTQRLALPDYRTDTYDISVSVRGVDATLEIRLTDPDGESLASESVPVTDEWERRDVSLTLEAESGSQYAGGDPGPVQTPYGEYVLVFAVETDEVDSEEGEEAHLDLDWASVVPEDAVEGRYNPETIERMRERTVTSTKWPGGNFTSQYHWEDGVGPLEERPVRPNLAWGGLESNTFGTDEYLEFCDLTDVEATITVGVSEHVDPADAANWVEYCNGDPAETEYGALRAEHGHPEPYEVETWEVGNEVWGPWQIGHTADAEAFAQRVLEFAEAMRAVDDSITILPDGLGPMYRDSALPDPDDWNRTLFDVVGDHLDGLGIHRYDWGIRNESERGAWLEENDAEPIEYSEVLVSFPTQYEEVLGELAADARAAGIEDVELTIGEWGLFPEVSGGWPFPGMDTMAGAVYVAGMFNTFCRRSDVVRRSSHTHLPVRAFPPENSPYPPNPNPLLPTGEVLELYSSLVTGGDWYPLSTTVDGPTRALPETGDRIREMDGVPFVDVLALEREDGGEWCVFAANRNLRAEGVLTLDTADVVAGGEDETAVDATITRLQPTGDPHDGQTSWDDPDAYEVTTSERTLEGGEALELELSPAGIVRIRLALA